MGAGPNQQPPSLGPTPQVSCDEGDQFPPELVVGTKDFGLVPVAVPQNTPDPDRQAEPAVDSRFQGADGPHPLLAVGDGQAPELGGGSHEVVHIGDAGFIGGEAGPPGHFTKSPSWLNRVQAPLLSAERNIPDLRFSRRR